MTALALAFEQDGMAAMGAFAVLAVMLILDFCSVRDASRRGRDMIVTLGNFVLVEPSFCAISRRPES